MSFNSLPARVTISVPALGLMQIQSRPLASATVPLVSTPISNRARCSASIKAPSICNPRFAAGCDNVGRAALPLRPPARNRIAERIRGREFPAARPVRPDKVGVAELADRLVRSTLEPRPKIAARKAAGRRRRARFVRLLLQREIDFLDLIHRAQVPPTPRSRACGARTPGSCRSHSPRRGGERGSPR